MMIDDVEHDIFKNLLKELQERIEDLEISDFQKQIESLNKQMLATQQYAAKTALRYFVEPNLANLENIGSDPAKECAEVLRLRYVEARTQIENSKQPLDLEQQIVQDIAKYLIKNGFNFFVKEMEI